MLQNTIFIEVGLNNELIINGKHFLFYGCFSQGADRIVKLSTFRLCSSKGQEVLLHRTGRGLERRHQNNFSEIDGVFSVFLSGCVFLTVLKDALTVHETQTVAHVLCQECTNKKIQLDSKVK